MKRLSGTRGFTLLELCAGLATLAVIVFLIVPVFSKVREQSQTAGCLANLRTWGVCIAAYAGDHQGELPPHQAPKNRSNPASAQISFYTLLAPYGGYTYPATREGAYRGTLLGCPAETSLGSENTNCYAMNIDLNYRVQQESGGYGFVAYVRVQDLHNASRYLLMSDAQRNSIIYTNTKVRFEEWTRATNRHGGIPNFLYADGHAAPFTAEFHGYSDAKGKTPFYRELFFANGVDPYTRSRR